MAGQCGVDSARAMAASMRFRGRHAREQLVLNPDQRQSRSDRFCPLDCIAKLRSGGLVGRVRDRTRRDRGPAFGQSCGTRRATAIRPRTKHWPSARPFPVASRPCMARRRPRIRGRASGATSRTSLAWWCVRTSLNAWIRLWQWGHSKSDTSTTVTSSGHPSCGPGPEYCPDWAINNPITGTRTAIKAPQPQAAIQYHRMAGEVDPARSRNDCDDDRREIYGHHDNGQISCRDRELNSHNVTAESGEQCASALNRSLPAESGTKSVQKGA